MDPSAMQGIDAFQSSPLDVVSSPDQPVTTTKHHLSKKRKCSESKPPAATQDLSALDCSDYWLRFDSDTESLAYAPDNDTASQSAAQSRR